jgi:hypothetical protein
VSDLKAPEGATIMEDPEASVVSIVAPAVEEEPAEEEAEGEAAAEGEGEGEAAPAAEGGESEEA